ncbi:MAG: patatin-like phospholipase family protein [Methylocystis sp.]|nr:patatin-like phospholipase family protein [Methylocystis sp.]
MSSPRAHKPPIAPETPNRRALILPGGGMRVAWQAGVAQRLHEEGLRFSFADGASGGTMNLAALLSGQEPEALAKAWRSLDPKKFISPQGPLEYLRFPFMTALGDFDGITDSVFPHLGTDISRLKSATGVAARFNICDFADKAVVSLRQDEISLEHLLAGISLPIFTPAVEKAGRTYTDAVWIRDSNTLEAVKAGANELWVAWCIGNTPIFHRGALNQYVHMIEMSALGAFNAELEEIARLNAEIATGAKPYGHERPIIVHVIHPALPIPLDPDYVAGKVSSDALVDQGYQDASCYLASLNPQGSPLSNAATATPDPARGLSFSEVMTGRIVFGAATPQEGGADWNGVPVSLRATINIRDIAAFVADPEHRGEMAAHVYCPRLGGLLPARRTNFQLFSPSGDARLALMVYEAGIVIDGRPHWLSGKKHVRRGPPWSLWRETTTLYVQLHDGPDSSAPIVAQGVLRLGVWEFLSLLAGLHARDCNGFLERASTLYAFARFFASRLMRFYGL